MSMSTSSRKHTNKFERRNTDALRTQQYTLHIVGASCHATVNHPQPIALNQRPNAMKQKKNLRGFLRVRIAFIVNSDPAVVVIVHPAVDRAAPFGREHGAGLADIIDADVARADDERY